MRRGRTHRLSPERARRLRRALDRLERASPPRRRLPLDPVSLPHRYRDPRDVEVAGLLAASLAYGRADLFLPKVDPAARSMGPSPAAFVRGLDVAGASALLEGFVYRFNVGGGRGGAAPRHGADARAHAAPWRRGSLAARREAGATTRRSAGSSGSSASDLLRRGARRSGRRAGWTTCSRCRSGRARRSGCTSTCAGWCAVRTGWTSGVWKRVPASALLVPLDTHVARLAWRLGLVRRRTRGWAAAEDITANLRVKQYVTD